MRNIFVMDNFLWIILVLNMFAHASTLWAYNTVEDFKELNVFVEGTLSNIYVFLFSTIISWFLIVGIYNVYKDMSTHQTYYHLLKLFMSVVIVLDFFIDLLSTMGVLIK